MLKWIIVFFPTLLLSKWELFYPVGQLKQAERSIAPFSHMCVQRRFSHLMGRLGCSWGTAPRVHRHCPLQRPILWEFLLNPNAMRLKEMKGDWLSTTVSCLHGMTVVNQSALVIAGNGLCDVCKHTRLQLEQIRKKPCSLFQSCWEKALIQVKFALTSWCSVHSLSLPVVFVKPCYALMWSWSIWAHDLLCCNCGGDKSLKEVSARHTRTA